MAALRGVGWIEAETEAGDDDWREAMSESGALGSRIPPSRGRGGDCELGSLGMEKDETAGELKEEGGAEPEE